MTAPSPFTNKEAEEWADRIEQLAQRATSDSVDQLAVHFSIGEGEKLAASLRWMATEQVEKPTKPTGTDVVLSARSNVPVKMEALTTALAEVMGQTLDARQRRDFEAGTLFAYWVSRTENPRSTYTREKATRLQRFIHMFGLETCLYAVDGVMGHPSFNHQDGKTFHDLSSIFKFNDTERVEKLSEYARKRDKSPRHMMILDLIAGGYQPKDDS